MSVCLSALGKRSHRPLADDRLNVHRGNVSLRESKQLGPHGPRQLDIPARKTYRTIH